MPPSSAELSSLATALDEILKRVSDAAAQFAADKRDDVAGDLYEVERMLATAQRRLAKTVDTGR